MATSTKKNIEETFKIALEKKNIEIKELKKEIKELNEELVDFKKSISNKSKGAAILDDRSDVKKKILEYRSRNYSPTIISNKLNLLGIDIDYEYVKEVCNNIDELDSELRLYYKECVENYEKEIKINPNKLKVTSVAILQANIDSCIEDLDLQTDVQMKRSLRNDLKQYVDTLNNLMKDNLTPKDSGNGIISEIDNSMKDYSKKTERVILNFNNAKISNK